MGRPLQLEGLRFGKLVAVRRSGNRRGSMVCWTCTCDCGNSFETTGQRLASGKTKSCGCATGELIAAKKRRHGLTGTAEYRIWSLMIQRCCNRKNPAYRLYGARGIKVCNAWRTSFAAFLKDMGARPSPRHTLDRRNNNGHYSPRNCRWATGTQQGNNRRGNRRVTIGRRTQTVIEWSRESGVRRETIAYRLNSGWAPQDAVFTVPQ